MVRNWRSKIVAIKDEAGHWVHDKELVKAQIVNYFSIIFTEKGDGVYDIPTDIFPELLLSDWNRLIRPYSHLEIEDVVQTMGSLSAPGPDKFQAPFYQKIWNLVKGNLLQTSMNVLEGKGLAKHLNDTLITLIPKVDHPECATQFTPIGLCNVAYKVITKVILNRIKPLLHKLISKTQGSFVLGLKITDNIVIAQEVIHTMRKK